MEKKEWEFYYCAHDVILGHPWPEPQCRERTSHFWNSKTQRESFGYNGNFAIAKLLFTYGFQYTPPRFSGQVEASFFLFLLLSSFLLSFYTSTNFAPGIVSDGATRELAQISRYSKPIWNIPSSYFTQASAITDGAVPFVQVDEWNKTVGKKGACPLPTLVLDCSRCSEAANLQLV